MNRNENNYSNSIISTNTSNHNANNQVEICVDVGELSATPPCLPLCKHLEKALHDYFVNLDGDMPVNLYQMVLEQVEPPLLQKVMHYVDHNQSKAADVLGISRSTLRKKLKQYGL